MTSQVKKRALIISALVAVAIASGVIFHVGTLLAKPVQHSVGPAPSNPPLELVEFLSRSGSLLRAWYAKGVPGGGGVVLLHGIRADRSSMLGRAEFLYANGYSVLLVDLQAHGESEGDRITFGFLESRDAESAVDYLRKLLPDERIGVLGTSLGGAACLLGTEPLKVDALVLEAVYPDVKQAIRNRLQIRFGKVGALLAPLLTIQIKPRLGFAPDQLRPIDRIAEVSAPVLIVAGQNDLRTSAAESMAMYSAAPEPKDIWLVPEASHVDLHRHNTTAYEARVLEFLGKHMRETG